MKKFFFLPVILFVSCSGNHYYDGTYKATIKNPGNWYNIHYEIMLVNGNDLFINSYGPGGDTGKTVNLKCKQYPGKIQYTNNRRVRTVTILDSNTLKFNEYVIFKKLSDAEADLHSGMK